MNYWLFLLMIVIASIAKQSSRTVNMTRLLRLWLAMTILGCLSCFKNLSPNQKALQHQKSCIESIELKDYERAQTHCELCLEFDQTMVECTNGLGLIYVAQKDENKAKDFFTQAIRQNNDYSQARNNLGVVYFAEGTFEKALRFFKKALEIDPGNLDARYNASLAYFRLAQNALARNENVKANSLLIHALKQINKLLAIEPNYAHALRDQGLIYLHQSELSLLKKESNKLLSLAQKSFDDCLKLDNSNDGCHEGLGFVNNKIGLFKEAFASYFQCIAYAPQNSACRNGIVETYEKSIKEEEGFRSSLALMQEKSNPNAHDAFCAILFSKGLIKDAVLQCEIAIGLNPNLCISHFRLADHFALILDSSKAIKYCQSFLVCSLENQNLKEQTKCQEILAAIKRG